jgi:hypothetical protein
MRYTGSYPYQKPLSCRSCGELIQFITSKEGKKIPCNLDMKKIVTTDGQVIRGYESHFSTCPNADEWRTKK